MTDDVREYVEQIVGQSCCCRRIRNDRSLTLGFGELRPKSKITGVLRGTWEFGTYYSSWRVGLGIQVVCGSQDVVDNVNELRQQLSSIEFGKFSAILKLNEIDIRLKLDNGVFIDMLATISSEDEVCHLFCKSFAVKYSIAKGWVIGRSDKPWMG